MHRGLIALSLFSALYMLGTLAMGQFYFFDPYLMSCQISGQTDPKPLFVTYTIIATVIFLSVPVVGIITANVAILVLVGRARGTGIPGINAVKTVGYVSWAFVISVIPTNVRVLLQVTNLSKLSSP